MSNLRACLAACACVVHLVAPSALAQGTPGAEALEKTAWNLLDAGELESALAEFRSAVARDSKNVRLHLGAAAAAYGLRRDAEARAALNSALALNPGLSAARELLGRLMYRNGDLLGAIAAFEGLEREGVTRLRDQLHRWRREAELRSRMLVEVGSGVTVEFEGPEDQTLAQRVVAAAERAAADTSKALLHYLVTPTVIVLYTHAQFRDIAQAPPWAAGAFDGTIRVVLRSELSNDAELDRVLRHEYTHALVRDLAPAGVPAWLNEGLAVALENEHVRISRPLALPPALQSVTSFHGMTGPDARRAYAASALAVGRLLDESGAFAMTSLLRDIGSGVPFDVAFERHMRRPFSDFETSLRQP